MDYNVSEEELWGVNGRGKNNRMGFYSKVSGVC